MKTRKLITICTPFIIGGVVALGLTPPAASVDGPDWTYAPCAWFNSGHVIPAYTHTDECVQGGELVER